MPGVYPAVVKSYDAQKRTCRVEIPGITDGGDVFPEAEILYPIGDVSKAGATSTEIKVSPGDMVYVQFLGGDPRYPVIVGARNAQTGNGTDWRRMRHANLELIADNIARVVGTAIEMKTAGEPKGVVQGDCICAYTGAPHIHVSATVKA